LVAQESGLRLELNPLVEGDGGMATIIRNTRIVVATCPDRLALLGALFAQCAPPAPATGGSDDFVGLADRSSGLAAEPAAAPTGAISRVAAELVTFM
jgi:hypothetical protein